MADVEPTHRLAPLVAVVVGVLAVAVEAVSVVCARSVVLLLVLADAALRAAGALAVQPRFAILVT